jgi:ABC-type Fe3+/spermidine/putrescine transport system ATPase subunit
MVLSDLIVIMNQGRIEQMGSAIEIYRRPLNRFVADFIGRANFLPVTVVSKEENQGANVLWQVKLFDLHLSVPAVASNKFTPGTPALLLVRPESIELHLTPPPRGGHPVIAGKLQHTSYLGSQVEYDIDVNNTFVTAVRHDPNEQLLYPVGSTVYLELKAENLYLLPVNSKQ